MSNSSKKCACGESEDIVARLSMSCRNCSTKIYDGLFEKPMKSLVIILLLGYGSSQFIDYAITDNRYPMATEYSIINACLNSHSEPVSYRVYGKKQKICLCAMEDTMNEISYVRYKVQESAFLESFELNAEACIDR